MLEIDAGGGPIILATRVHRGGAVITAQVFGEGFRLEGARSFQLAVDMRLQKEGPVTIDHMLGQGFGLDQEEPPEFVGREILVGTGVGLGGRDDVEKGEPLDRVGVIEHQAVGNPRAAIVAGQRKTPMAECIHDRHLVPGHFALRIGRVVAGPAVSRPSKRLYRGRSEVDDFFGVRMDNAQLSRSSGA